MVPSQKISTPARMNLLLGQRPENESMPMWKEAAYRPTVLFAVGPVTGMEAWGIVKVAVTEATFPEGGEGRWAPPRVDSSDWEERIRAPWEGGERGGLWRRRMGRVLVRMGRGMAVERAVEARERVVRRVVDFILREGQVWCELFGVC